MRRSHRRAHLILWLIIAPAAAAGLFVALTHAPSAPVENIDDALITGAAD